MAVARRPSSRRTATFAEINPSVKPVPHLRNLRGRQPAGTSESIQGIAGDVRFAR
jgi:hypothetical protein